MEGLFPNQHTNNIVYRLCPELESSEMTKMWCPTTPDIRTYHMNSPNSFENIFSKISSLSKQFIFFYLYLC